MKRSPRIQTAVRAAKWAGLTVTIVVIALSAYSRHEPVCAWVGGWQRVALDRGQLEVLFRPDQRLIAPVSFERGIVAYTGMTIRTWPAGGFEPVERVAWVEVPMLWLWAIAGLPTGLLWWLDRRRRSPCECTQCGYDRTGLAPGAVCPECGGSSACT